jgi:hypothetical protein
MNGSGIWTVEPFRRPAKRLDYERRLPTEWNWRTLDPELGEPEIIAEGLARDLAHGLDTLAGLTP